MFFLILVSSFAVLSRIAYGVLAPYRDSGDLVAASVCLGVAHPPGYPLYVLLSKIWLILFPFANFAFRANLFSAFCTALSAAILFLVLSRWVSKSGASIAVALWVLSPSVVQLSIVSEMYALNSLICVLILWIASKSRSDCRQAKNWAALAFFTLGLGINNQPTLIFLLPGLVIYSWFGLTEETVFQKMKILLQLSFWSVLGFSLILFDPIRSFQNPSLDWGNPESFRNLWRLITRSDYGGLKLHPEQSQFFWTGSMLVSQLKLFWSAVRGELGWFGLSLSGAGIIRCIARKETRKPEVWLVSIPWVLAGPLFFILSNLPVQEKTTLPILEPYLLMVQVFASYWVAIGWEGVMSSIEWTFFRSKIRVKWAVTPVAAAAIIAILLPHSRRNQFYAYDYGKNLAKTMPLQSSLYEPDDVTAFTLSYLQIGEGYRNDIALLMTLKTFWGYDQIKKRYPDIVPQEEFSNAQSFIAALLTKHGELKRPLFADHPSKFPEGMSQFPSGLMARAEKLPAIDEFIRSQNSFYFYVERGTVRMDGQDFFTRHLLSKVSSSLNNAGIWLQSQKSYDDAKLYFERALNREPALTPGWNNLGLNYFLREDFAGAEQIFRRGLARGENPTSLYIPLGLAQRRLGELGLARQSLLEGLKSNASNITALNELGLIDLQGKKWNDAKNWFEKAVQIQQDYATGHYNLGLVNRALGLKGEAAKNFQNYLKFDPAASDAGRVRQWISVLAGT